MSKKLYTPLFKNNAIGKMVPVYLLNYKFSICEKTQCLQRAFKKKIKGDMPVYYIYETI